MGDDTAIRTYEGETVIVPLDVNDAASVEQLEEKVRGLVDGIGEDEDIHVRPRDGGDSVEVSVLSEETHTAPGSSD